jgi:hypothetical protein
MCNSARSQEEPNGKVSIGFGRYWQQAVKELIWVRDAEKRGFWQQQYTTLTVLTAAWYARRGMSKMEFAAGETIESIEDPANSQPEFQVAVSLSGTFQN